MTSTRCRTPWFALSAIGFLAVLPVACQKGTDTRPTAGAPEGGLLGEPVVIEARATFDTGFRPRRGYGDPDKPTQVSTCSVSADGGRVVVGGYAVDEADVQVWDVAGAAPTKVAAFNGYPAVVSPDGQSIAGYNRGSFDKPAHLFVRGVAGNPRKVADVDLGPADVKGLGFLPGGEVVVRVPDPKSKGAFDDPQTTRVVGWDPATGAEKFAFAVGQNEGLINCFPPFGDGTRIASSHGNGQALELRVWEIPTGRRVQTIRAGGRSEHAFWKSVNGSGDGRRIATEIFGLGKTVWDAADGRELHLFADSALGEPVLSRDGSVVFLEKRPRRLGAGPGPGIEIVALNATSEHTRAIFRGHTAPVTALAVSANDRVLVSGDDAGIVKVWDLAALK